MTNFYQEIIKPVSRYSHFWSFTGTFAGRDVNPAHCVCRCTNCREPQCPQVALCTPAPEHTPHLISSFSFRTSFQQQLKCFFIKAGRQTWIFNLSKLLKQLVLKNSKMRTVKSACLIFCQWTEVEYRCISYKKKLNCTGLILCSLLIYELTSNVFNPYNIPFYLNMPISSKTWNYYWNIYIIQIENTHILHSRFHLPFL